MSVSLESVFKNNNIGFEKFRNYSEATIPHLNQMKIRFDNLNIICLDIDINDKCKFINEFNIYLIGKKVKSIKYIESIFEEVKNKISDNHNLYNVETNDDPLFLFGKNKVISKNIIDRELVLEKFKTSDRKINKNITAGLKLNHKQVFEMIYSEVDKINKNMEYQHYINFKDNDPYTLEIRFKYDKGELADKLKKIYTETGIDYIEIILKLDNTLYPFIPPSIEYSKPNISTNVIHNISNIDILKDKKWNSNISIEWLVKEIGKQFEPYFNKYIDTDNIAMKFTEIDKLVCEIYSLYSFTDYDNFNIKFNIPKYENVNKNEYWNSGTGYGYNSSKESWNINNFLATLNDKNNKIINKFLLFIGLFTESENEDNAAESIKKLIITQYKGTNVLDLNKNKRLFGLYIDIIEIMEINIDFSIISDLYYEIKEIIENESCYKELENDIKILYDKTYKLFKSQEKVINKQTIITDDEKSNYNIIVKDNIFGTFELDNTHLFFCNKDDKVTNKKNLLRIISEISSLKKNLPINWDTSCVLRVDKKYTNMIKFVITGPKDTPYHNGVYEFHAYFPPTYPSEPPNVLINTTDGGKVRFNPNLYASGKVCLSLLGTWSGQESEKWNSDISTFLQVIISIQSLIMVDDPYFNEPGYERTMNTSDGKKRAFKYKEEIRLHNLRVAIINQIKNPPVGFEEFTINHFKAKKNEIIETANKWLEESENSKTKIEAFIKHINELI